METIKNQTTDFKNFLFRAHAVGKLAVGLNTGLTAKQKITLEELKAKQSAGKITAKQTIALGDLLAKETAPTELSKGVKTYLEDLWREEVFNRRNRIENEKLEKGIVVESKSFSLFTRISEENLLFRKNVKSYKNSFFKGTPDNVQLKVRDIKSSWELSTFPMFEDKIKNAVYYWQLQTYMDLTGLNEAQLIFCLVDTPFNLIDDTVNRLAYKHNFADSNGDILEDWRPLVVETVCRMIYTWDGLRSFCDEGRNPKYNIPFEWFEDEFKEIPEKARVTIIEVEKDEDGLKAMKKQIVEARKYLNELSAGLAEKLSL